MNTVVNMIEYLHLNHVIKQFDISGCVNKTGMSFNYTWRALQIKFHGIYVFMGFLIFVSIWAARKTSFQHNIRHISSFEVIQSRSVLR